MPLPPLSPAIRPSDTTAGSGQRNDSAKPHSSKDRPTDKHRRAIKSNVKKKHSVSRSLVKRRGGSAKQPLKDSRPPSRPITPSVRELNWRMFDTVVCAQLMMALLVALLSLSLGAIGLETTYLFVMAVLLAACTAPSLYYLSRHDIETGITAFSVFHIVSASCSLMVCAVAIFGHDYADFSAEDRAYNVLFFVVWQYACVVAVCFKPYTEVSMKDLKARLQRLRGQKQKESRGRSSSSAESAPSPAPAREEPDNVVLRPEPQQQRGFARADYQWRNPQNRAPAMEGHDNVVLRPEPQQQRGFAQANYQWRNLTFTNKELNSATQNQDAKIADTKANKPTSNAALPVGNKVSTSQTSKLESSKLQPATAAKDESNIPTTSALPATTSASDVDVAMKQATSPCGKTSCPSPASRTNADSTYRP